ncbi:MAG: hypothetical protein MK207_10460 [Saprospiraceae bacterium]|nr:hypothetical protein [Saprospiraceae bacterium]
MKKQNINREYNFPDSDLYAQCKERIQYILRDLKEFESYAYHQKKIDEFLNLCKQFSDLPDDDELIGNQMEATDKKNIAKEKLKTAIRSVMTRVSNRYHVRSGHYRKFGTVKMNDMSDPKLLLCGRRVVRVSNKLLDFLSETGLKQIHIDTVQKSAAAFENAIHIQQDKVSDRDISVEKRIDLGNRLYRELVHVCNIGKDIWAEKNKAKYENYTIYESNNDQKIARKKKESEKR